MEYDHNRRNRNKTGGVVLLGIVTALVLGSFLFSFRNQPRQTMTVDELLESAAAAEAEAGSKTSALDNLEDLFEPVEEETRVRGPLDVSDVAEAVMPSIVSITSQTMQVVESYFYGRYEIPSESAGSGIIIGQSDTELLIATNYHVVEDGDSLTVCFSAETEDAEDALASALLKGSDASKDLAVVAVNLDDISQDVLSQIRVASLGDSDELVVGETAVAIGNALGYGQSVTAGIISAVNRELTVEQVSQNFIQTDAAINFGNSGGALLNRQGQVIGINSVKATAQGVERMGYAIPINEAKPILEELMSRETREKVEEGSQGRLGISAKDVSQEAIEIYNISAGAFISEVYAGSAAEAAGLARGDIITEFDGSRVDSASALENLLSYYAAGEEVEIVFQTSREGAYQEMSTTAVLQEAGEEVSGGTGTPDPYYEERDPYSWWYDFMW